MITSYPREAINTVPSQNRPYNSISIRRFGTNIAVGTTFVSIDNIGIATPYMPSTALKFEVVSSSANDTAVGSGARTIEVTGIDNSWNLATETINLNGVTAVQSVGTYYRVIKAEVKTVGSYGATNAGNILVRGTGGGSSFVQIDTSNGQSFASHFCVPLGYYGAITGANISTDSGKVINTKVLSRDNANNTSSLFAPTQLAQYFEGLTGVHHFDYEPPILITPCTDVWISAKVASGTAAVSAEYWGWIAPT